MAENSSPSEDLPTVSKQTAGGITGAVAGAVVGGPVGALIGGVAGALVGRSSAKGKKPIKKAIDVVRARTLGRAKKGGSASATRSRQDKVAPKKSATKKGRDTVKKASSKAAKAAKKARKVVRKTAKAVTKRMTSGSKKSSKRR